MVDSDRDIIKLFGSAVALQNRASRARNADNAYVVMHDQAPLSTTWFSGSLGRWKRRRIYNIVSALRSGEADAFISGDGLLQGTNYTYSITVLKFRDPSEGERIRQEFLKLLDDGTYVLLGEYNKQRNREQYKQIFGLS